MKKQTINKAVLLEMASRWENDAVAPEKEDGSPLAQRGNDLSKGIREGKRECADGLRTLISLL